MPGIGYESWANLTDLSEPLQSQAQEIQKLFQNLHDTLLVPVLVGATAGIVPFALSAIPISVMESRGQAVPEGLCMLLTVLLCIALPVMGVAIFLLKRMKYNADYDAVAETIKNTLAQDPEWQEALTVLRSRDGFVDRHAKLIGLK